uniref:Enoyl-CoA hydratase n=1 Tax=Nocardioides sp. (strain JS1661) TaxID=1517491 RepID=A0A089MWG6_NOCS1|nr:enoyl-CoA hydratase [Nocardioides sp. JS1661]
MSDSLAPAPTETPRLCRLELEGAVATITLDRSDARNALNLDLLHALIEHLEESASVGASVLVLRAEGRAFCAGADLRSDDGTLLGRPGLRRELIERSLELVSSFPVSIAVVQGPAVGGGWGLAFAADIVVAADDALFKFPELALGFVPPDVIVRRFVQLAGSTRALRLLGSGEPFRADDPALGGLLEPVPPSELDRRAHGLADHFARAAPGLLEVLKRQIATANVHERHSDE